MHTPKCTADFPCGLNADSTSAKCPGSLTFGLPRLISALYLTRISIETDSILYNTIKHGSVASAEAMEDHDTICGFIAGCFGILKEPPSPARGDADVVSSAIPFLPWA